jgi:hypothetical protein
MIIRKFNVNDDFGFFSGWWNEPVLTEGFLGKLNCNYYNPETHELIPKKSYLERELKEKEEQLATLKQEIEDIKKRL